MLEHSNHRETQADSALSLRRGAGGFTGTFQTVYSKLLPLSHYCLVTVYFTFHNFYTEERHPKQWSPWEGEQIKEAYISVEH